MQQHADTLFGRVASATKAALVPVPKTYRDLVDAYDALRACRVSGAADLAAQAEAVARAHRAREAHFVAEHDRLRHGIIGDNLRAQLLVCYGALLAVADLEIGLRSSADWVWMLEELFDEPDPAEALAAFCAATPHPLPKM